MRSTRHLMSIEQAAGFAMAPSEDDMATPHEPHLDDALRNGHLEAARTSAAPVVFEANSHLLPLASRVTWLRETLSGWWPGGRAHA